MIDFVDYRYSPRLSWTCIGRPDDEHKSLVRQDGSLQYGWNRVIGFGLRHALQTPRLEQRTESPGSAVVVTKLDYGFATLELTAFAQEENGERTDVVLWELHASETCTGMLVGSLALTVDESDRGGLSRLMPEASCEIRAWKAPVPTEPVPVLLRSVPFALGVCEDYEHVGRNVFCTEPEPVSPGGRLRGAVLIPLDHANVEGRDLKWCEQALASSRTFWAGYTFQSLALQVPDAGIQNLITASARNILQARVIKEGLPFYQVGPLVYRGLWVVDGHFMTEVARYLGQDREADLAWDALLKFRREDGSITIHPHHTKETGIALATLVRMTELSGNWERLREHWDIVRGAIERIRLMREEANQLPANHPCHGLLPESYGDGGIGGKRPEYTTSLWILAGLRQMAAAARRLGQEDAGVISGMYEDLLGDFRRHAQRHRVEPAGGIPYLPMTMTPGEHNFGLSPEQSGGHPKPWTLMGPGVATWALCQSIYPGEVFSPDDEIVRDLLGLNDVLDDEEGLPAETGWLPWRAVWTYHASFAAHVALYAGEPAKAVEYLYAMANHAAPTGVWREEQSLASHPQSRYVGDMPHNWASAEFIRLVRNLLVFEAGEDLHLLGGLPAQWIVPGRPVVVERTPTRFGPVSLRVEAEDSQVRVRIRRDLNWPWQPQRVLLHLPVEIAGIEFEGVLEPDGCGSWILPEVEEACIGFQLANAKSA